MATFEIAVPADLTVAKLRQRFDDFKKYGFHNIGDHKINLYLLGCKEVEPGNVCEGWPEGITATYFQTPYAYVAQRIYYYYDKMILPNRADWYIRMDEDSMTNFEGLGKVLESDFDPKREYHLVAHANIDIYKLDQTLLTMLGYGRWYRPNDNHIYNDTPPHEVEIGISSNAAIQRLYACADAMKYFNMRKEFAEGWGDHGLTHAMRIAKVYPTICKFLTFQAELSNFSLWGGMRHHIHWISRDRNPKILIWLDMFTGEKIPEVSNAAFFLGKPDAPKKVVKMASDNSVQTLQHAGTACGEPIGLWCKVGDKLAIYTEEKSEEIGLFEKVENNRWKWKDIELVKISG